MAIVSTQAIVLSALKYGETSLIVKCFTKKEGIKSYMLRGVLKSKKGKLKPAYFQPLTQLQLTASHNHKNTLNSIKEVQVVNPYVTIYASVIKQSIILFLSEILSDIIKEEEQNEGLYNYLEAGLIWLDTHDSITNFHLLFLLNLSKFLGFYPDIEEKGQGFNLLEGNFTNSITNKLTISGQELIAFKKLLGINFDAIHKVSFNMNYIWRVLKNLNLYVF